MNIFKKGLSFGTSNLSQTTEPVPKAPMATVGGPERYIRHPETKPQLTESKKTMPASDKKSKKKRTKKARGHGKWNLSVYRIFKSLRDGKTDNQPRKVQMTKKVLNILSGITDDLSEELLRQASNAKSSTSRQTLQVKDVLLATHLIFPNEVGVEAAHMGTKAIQLLALK